MKVCFVGHKEAFNQFLSVKQAHIPNPLINATLLNTIEDHEHCEKTIKELLEEIEGQDNKKLWLENFKRIYKYMSDIGQLLFRKKNIPPSPLSLKYKDLFDLFYTIY